MALEFQGGGANGWRTAAGRIPIFVDDGGGRPDASQVALVEELVATLDSVAAQAAQYLDLFVDRRRACGGADEEWWFEEVELRKLKPDTCQLSFTLYGDGDGLWSVEMVARHGTFWPVRFERQQG